MFPFFHYSFLLTSNDITGQFRSETSHIICFIQCARCHHHSEWNRATNMHLNEPIQLLINKDMHLTFWGHFPQINHPTDSSAWPFWQSLGVHLPLGDRPSEIIHRGSQCQNFSEDMPLPWEGGVWPFSEQSAYSPAFQLPSYVFTPLSSCAFLCIHLHRVSADIVLPLNFPPAILQATLTFHVQTNLVSLADFCTSLLVLFMGIWDYTNSTVPCRTPLLTILHSEGWIFHLISCFLPYK